MLTTLQGLDCKQVMVNKIQPDISFIQDNNLWIKIKEQHFYVQTYGYLNLKYDLLIYLV